jgi:hypothetical protein
MFRNLVIDSDKITMQTHWYARTETFLISDIVTTKTGRSLADIPFWEESIIFYTKDGKKHPFRHVRNKKIKAIIDEITSYNSSR